MDRDALERLLIDRGLGQLAPDTELLLTAYLEHDSPAGERARSFDDTANLARRALRSEPGASLPPFPRDRMLEAERSWRRWRFARGGASLAACLVLGLGLGWGMFRTPQAARGPQHLIGGTHWVRHEATTDGQDVSDFWSATRLYQRAVAERRQESPRLIWDSPLAQPRKGGAA
jgi:hypothetical protein